jgi:hypothetical protein
MPIADNGFLKLLLRTYIDIKFSPAYGVDTYQLIPCATA